MNTDEINRYIHEQIMGKCWHEFNGAIPVCDKCSKQAGDMQIDDWVRGFHPNYCSEGSPRRLLNEVIATMILQDSHGCSYPFIKVDGNVPYGWEDLILTTAEQIARSCVAAHKGVK